MLKQPQSFRQSNLNTLRRKFIYYHIPIFIICIYFLLMKEKHLTTKFSPDIPLNEIRLSNFTFFQQPFYVFTFTPLKTSSLVIKKLNHHALLMKKYGDYYHPLFKFYCFDKSFLLYLYPHNTDNEIYLTNYDNFTGKLILGFKLSFFIFVLFCVIISLYKLYPNEFKYFLVLTLFYSIYKLTSFLLSIPLDYLFQSLFFGLFIIITIYQLQITKLNTFIVYTLYMYTFIIITFFYLSNLFIILQKAMILIWSAYNAFFVYILMIIYDFKISNFLKKKILLAFSLLNSIFIYSIIQTHVNGNNKALLLTFLDLLMLSSYIIYYMIYQNFIEKINCVRNSEENLNDIPII